MVYNIFKHSELNHFYFELVHIFYSKQKFVIFVLLTEV